MAGRQNSIFFENLLKDVQRQFNLSYLFISHDLSVVRYMSDAVSVMYLGRVVESAPTQVLFDSPQHPYTRALIDSIPKMIVGGDPSRLRLSGEIPDPRNPPSGCRFRTRCPVGPLAHPDRAVCIEADPHRNLTVGVHVVACHFPLREKQPVSGA